jgi:hypothetical protein
LQAPEGLHRRDRASRGSIIACAPRRCLALGSTVAGAAA